MSCASDIGGAWEPPPPPAPWESGEAASAGGDGGVAGRACLDDLCLAPPSRGLLANAVVQATMSSSRRTCATAAASVA
uniref:Uncharacterized protein n=1 Tax=Oryza brachyantha TaxID=4533 RepID=J3M1Z8_ORYBR